jgi:hypothetical protein
MVDGGKRVHDMFLAQNSPKLERLKMQRQIFAFAMILRAIPVGAQVDPIWNLRPEIREAVLLLREFEKEKPTNCKSEKLELALDQVRSVRLYNSLEAKRASADGQLIVADVARKASCLDFADATYRDVIATFIGMGYVSHRQRAEIGIDDVREARRNKIESK